LNDKSASNHSTLKRVRTASRLRVGVPAKQPVSARRRASRRIEAMLCEMRAYVHRFDHSEPSGSEKSGQGSEMYRLIRQTGIFVVAFLSCTSPGMTWDDNWTVVTMTRDGSWGVACNSSRTVAVAEAIRFCKGMAGPASGCGAQIVTARTGWIIANICGDHQVIATGETLHDAQQEAMNREIDLQQFYQPDLPACRRVLTIDIDRLMVSSNLRYSAR
jgi:hypothetical protein